MSIEEDALKMCKGKHTPPLCIYCGPIAIGIKAERERCARIVELEGYGIWQGQADTAVAMMCIAERIRNG